MKILVTGAASGIGRHCVERLRQRYGGEAEVIGIDRNDLDLRDTHAVRAFGAGLAGFDAFIHAAGLREIEAPADLSLETWNDVMNVNVTACFLLTQALIRDALAAGRPLAAVNIASVSAFQGEPDRAAYVASKHALVGLTKQLAYQYGRCGVRVNAIAPGVVETPLTASYFSDPVLAARLRAAIPVGHWGQPTHLWPLIEQCLDNPYLNGSVLVCDGGWTAGRDL